MSKEVAAEGGALCLGGLSQCPSYLTGLGEQKVKEEFRKQVKVFVEEDLDFLLCEVIFHGLVLLPVSVCIWVLTSENQGYNNNMV